VPLVFCENPACERNAGANPDPAIFDGTYRFHMSHALKELQHETKRRAREHWNAVLLPAAKYVARRPEMAVRVSLLTDRRSSSSSSSARRLNACSTKTQRRTRNRA